MTEQFLNQARLANRWQISPRTLERWRWKGEGPAFVKIGGRVVYRLEEIEAYEGSRRCESTSQSTALRRAE
jgi:predicted site-specific integrase-resolvase